MRTSPFLMKLGNVIKMTMECKGKFVSNVIVVLVVRMKGVERRPFIMLYSVESFMTTL